MLAYIHIQKTAGQTVRSILRKNYGVRHCDLPVNPARINSRVISWIYRCYPALDALSGHAVVPGGILDLHANARVFTFLREPVARAISHYQFSNRRLIEPESLADWVTRNTNRQVRTLAGEDNLDKAIEFLETKVGFIGLTEQFDESMVMIQKWANQESLDIRYARVNVANNNKIRQKITSSEIQIELVQETNQLDIALYEYVKSTIYPRQQITFGPDLGEATSQFKQSLSGARNTSFHSISGKIKRNVLLRPRFNRLLS